MAEYLILQRIAKFQAETSLKQTQNLIIFRNFMFPVTGDS